ncbi:MAG: hypothetical protein ACFFAY_00800 [Promethearchaeota archaeon]
MDQRDEITKSTFRAFWICGVVLYFGIVLPILWASGYFEGFSWGDMITVILVLGGVVICIGIIRFCDVISSGEEFKNRQITEN